MKPRTALLRLLPVACASLLPGAASAGDDLPSFDEVSKGYEKVVTNGEAGLYTLYTREKDAQVLAELPSSFESQKIYVHNVVSGGNPLAGVGILMSGEHYASWKRIGNKLALMEPDLDMRASGSTEDKRSRDELFTDSVLVSTPIVAMGPGGGPVIDLDALLVQGSSVFFGPMTAGADVTLARITEAKAFPHNVELAFRLPLGKTASEAPMLGLDPTLVPPAAGRMTDLHYSILLVPSDPDFQPREADPRVGFFTTSFDDLSRTTEGPETWVRYITRWKLEKADPSLRLSPPKEPLRWYIESTTPIKYRRYIRDALLTWNRVFEKIGISGAIEVYQQDARTGAYMDLDPEDMRYNFIRWNNNQAAFAIGPSRANPETGQIFDADVTINAGIIGHFANDFRTLIPALAVEGFTGETMAWLDAHPRWDPRIRMAAPAERERLLAARAAGLSLPEYPAGLTAGLGSEIQDQLARAGVARGSQAVECLAGAYAALGTDMIRLAVEGGEVPTAEGADLLDGLPESYIGQLLHWIVLHEVGHCLGLRHNFMASTTCDLTAINSADWPADRATGGSVMEYTPPNIDHGLGDTQGQWLIQQPGPYDDWAIDYGYGFHDDLAPVLAKAPEPDLVYGDNSDAVGPDPRVRTYDFGSDPIRFCESRMDLIHELRGQILEKMVKDGEGWGEARKAYGSLLAQHVTALSIVAGWVGGSFVHKDVKGNPGDRAPIEDVPAETQRRALRFVIGNSFDEKAFGLTPDLIRHLTVDRWGDTGDRATWDSDPAFPVHDMVQSVQAIALTMLMNPTTLRRIHDDELRAAPGDDVLGMPEVLSTIVEAAFDPKAEETSLRRNLQSEVVERLIDLSLDERVSGAAARPLAELCRQQLRELRDRLSKAPASSDPYRKAHVADLTDRIGRVLEASYVVPR